jgi:prophage maintenance system killer protein
MKYHQFSDIDESTWLTEPEIAALFETNNIHPHILSIFQSGELDADIHTRRSGNVDQYSADLIIAIGYRISAQFRSWTNHLIKSQSRTVHQSNDEANALMQVITDYTYALDILDRYDHRTLTIEGTHTTASFTATYDNAMSAINSLRDKFGGSWLFGNEKDESFKSSIANIYQSFAGSELYPSIEEKAAHLLYFVVKNHSFSDGNKRIAAFLFIWFLEKNHILYRKDGSKRIADNALVALTLMIAESKADEKDIMAQVVVNLINDYN